MASVNKVILIGNLGRDPEIRYTPRGEAVSNIAIATTENWKDRTTGERKERTEWHRVSFFGKLAEVVAMHLKKGASIYVEGSLRSRIYKDRDGTEKTLVEVRADSMQMLSSRPAQPGHTAQAAQATQAGHQQTHDAGRIDASLGPAHAAYALAQSLSHKAAEDRAEDKPAADDNSHHLYSGIDMPDDIPF